jgi:hypothetical protein
VEPWSEPSESLAFAAPVANDRRPRWLRGAERGAPAGILAIAVGSAPSFALYLWQHWHAVSVDTWRVLIAQVATFTILTGALWGLCVGAAIGLTPLERTARTDSGTSSRGAQAARRALLAAAAGALGTAPAGLVGAIHFGSLTTPYFGGREILFATIATTIVAGIAFARIERRTSIPRALGCTVAAMPLVLICALPLAALPNAAVLLQLDAMRFIATLIGLGPLGLAVGATLGAFAGAWMGLTSALAN